MFESLIGNCHVSPYMPVLYVPMKFCMVRPTRLLRSTVLLPVGRGTMSMGALRSQGRHPPLTLRFRSERLASYSTTNKFQLSFDTIGSHVLSNTL